MVAQQAVEAARAEAEAVPASGLVQDAVGREIPGLPFVQGEDLVSEGRAGRAAG